MLHFASKLARYTTTTISTMTKDVADSRCGQPSCGETHTHSIQLELLARIRQMRKERPLLKRLSKFLEETQREYNETVDSLNKLRAMSHSDPLDTFPPELFSQIIYDAIFPSIDTFEDAMKLTRVSESWKEFVVNTPLFWTAIHISGRVPSHKRRLSTCLKHSKEMPVTLTLVLPCKEWDDIQSELQSHRNRIQALALRGTAKDTEQFIPALGEILPLPNLHKVSISKMSEASVIHWFLDTFPTLIEMEGGPFSIDMLHRLNSRNWKHIMVKGNLDVAMPALEAIPLLESVTCLSGLVNPGSSSAMHTGTKQDSPNQLIPWKSFVHQGSGQMSIPILSRMLNLTSLTLVASISGVLPIAKMLYNLSRLEDITLKILENEDDIQFSALSDISPSKSVRSLRLDVKSSALTTANKLKTMPLEDIMDIFLRAVPSIDTLTLEGSSITPVLHNYKRGECLQSLHRIDLRHSAPLSEIHGMVHLSCDIVNIFGLRSTSNLPIYSSQTAKHLTVYTTITSSSQQEFVAFNSSAWPSLETLTIPVAFFSLNPTLNLRHLRKLSLFNDDLPLYSSLRGVTGICHFLAMDISHCPDLETLSFGHCPEWDIYFIMLESRILNQTRGSKPLKTLGLPSYTPPYLLRYIHEFIQGRLPVRASNLEFSLVGSMDRLLDGKM
jgi:hypothetical protein